jgi:hypothetical protein
MRHLERGLRGLDALVALAAAGTPVACITEESPSVTPRHT